MNISRFKLTAGDGAEIQAEFTKDETQKIKGVVIVVHGFGEHIGSYRELTRVLAGAGYASIVFNQRGHGDFRHHKNPVKMQGIIPDYETLLDDIDNIKAEAKRLVPDVPVALYGHSMGGNIILNYLLRRKQDDYACAVLESPWLGLYKELNVFTDRVAKILGFLSSKIAIFNKLSPEQITGDESVNDEYDDDPLYHNRISLRLYAGVKNGCAYALKNASKVTIPVYLASAKQEMIVCNKSIAQFTGSTGSNVTAKEYEGYHAIRKSSAREEFFKDIVDYLSNNM